MFSVASDVSGQYRSKEYPTLDSWKAACEKLPSNRALLGQAPPAGKLQTALPKFDPVAEALLAVFNLFTTGTMNKAENWVGGKPKDTEFFNAQRAYFLQPPIPFQPFAQKLSVPNGSEVIFHGDFHGDIHSFVAMLDSLNQSGKMDGFRLAKPNTYMVFLGDSLTEATTALSALHNATPQVGQPQVFMARGNHEDIQMIASYGFLAECQKKYDTQFSPGLIARLYDFFPVVIYAGSGSDYIQCNHGGMEPGYLPGNLLESRSPIAFQLLGEMRGGDFSEKASRPDEGGDPTKKPFLTQNIRNYMPTSPMQPVINGFMWNDFTVFAEEPGVGYKPGRGFVYGKTGTKIVLDASAGAKARCEAFFGRINILRPSTR